MAIPVSPVTSISFLRVERIVSIAQSSPEGFWYDQPEDEWVLEDMDGMDGTGNSPNNSLDWDYT